ncbi:protein-glutamate O-methyltransferase CheR [Catenovulum sp. 2E275]|uniref:CheR family methyltransferase n=1 Tax=Catenovulum sp. 2E275 TaxID=2980497 RepID=UPI0021D366FE|nr:protein-glutamate O-methyltransferase CheR [Catenovulum sp. 2E275]MCU4676438.1 protein-glutamate O-methyltransferase CheR [Catenovulum sp. 2E275]
MLDKDISSEDYKKFCIFLEHQCGIVLGDNKQYLVKSRLTPLMNKFEAASLSEVVNRSMSITERQLRAAVVDAMTTNETLWFRDSYPFEVLIKDIFPQYDNKFKTVKIWSAAASSGQEPYSIAMCSAEHQQRKMNACKVQVLGTDISPSMLDLCKSATYDSLALARGLSPQRKQQFFEPAEQAGYMKLKPNVTQMVSFRQMNLLDSYSLLGKFDIIFCRNVLIYFSAQNKAKILKQFAQALNPDGYLFLGASESISGLSEDFVMQRCNPGIVYRLKNK